MDQFLKDFFPKVYRKQLNKGHESAYCKFDSQLLTLFTSSLYLAALVASFFASVVTRMYGRKMSMTVGGISFLIGAIINGAAVNIAMLIIGRLMLGVGVGFANQVKHICTHEKPSCILIVSGIQGSCSFHQNPDELLLWLYRWFQCIFQKWHQQRLEEPSTLDSKWPSPLVS